MTIVNEQQRAIAATMPHLTPDGEYVASGSQPDWRRKKSEQSATVANYRLQQLARQALLKRKVAK